MRGSVYFQTAMIAKAVFHEGAKKVDRVNPNHQNFQKIASFGTMETYRKIWNDLGYFVHHAFGIKNLELLRSTHIAEFMETKLSEKISHQHLQKISSALGKLEHGLNIISIQFEKYNQYDFSIRLQLVKMAKKEERTTSNYRNRAYASPEDIISLLEDEKFKIAASIQLDGGSRAEGVCLIKRNQLKGIAIDKLTKISHGWIETKEKGGKVGLVQMGITTYKSLEKNLIKDNIFQIDYRRYSEAISKVCRRLNVKSEGSHGFRWYFAQNRLIEYQSKGKTYEEALQFVSWEMKHMRADITVHYTG